MLPQVNEENFLNSYLDFRFGSPILFQRVQCLFQAGKLNKCFIFNYVRQKYLRSLTKHYALLEQKRATWNFTSDKCCSATPSRKSQYRAQTEQIRFIFDQEPKTSGDNDSNFAFFYFHREHEISIGNSYYLYYLRN